MRHHYWEWPIASYLFLGGLGGGIYFLAMVFGFFVLPGFSMEVFAWAGFISLVCLAFGCFLLVFELGQPGVFYRAFIKSTSIICWGARLLSVCLIFGFFWWLSYLPWGWAAGIAGFFTFFRGFNLLLAGISGFGIMVYTGLMFSTLKSHAFWATPALPVLFTTSALSTACAAITLCLGFTGFWTADNIMLNYVLAEYIHELLHMVDIILVIAEITILLLYVLSLVGAGNVAAKQVADRWVKGKTAPLFWGVMVGLGLVLPLIIYITSPNAVIAPVIILLSGLLLRFLFVYSDDRRDIPGEIPFYTKLPSKDAAFLHAFPKGQNLY